MHFIEEDLIWQERGIYGLALIYEVETYLWNWAEAERLYGPMLVQGAP